MSYMYLNNEMMEAFACGLVSGAAVCYFAFRIGLKAMESVATRKALEDLTKNRKSVDAAKGGE